MLLHGQEVGFISPVWWCCVLWMDSSNMGEGGIVISSDQRCPERSVQPRPQAQLSWWSGGNQDQTDYSLSAVSSCCPWCTSVPFMDLTHQGSGLATLDFIAKYIKERKGEVS